MNAFWKRYDYFKRQCDTLTKHWLAATDEVEIQILKARVKLAYAYWRRAALAKAIVDDGYLSTPAR